MLVSWMSSLDFWSVYSFRIFSLFSAPGGREGGERGKDAGGNVKVGRRVGLP
jgi:hypothetical protein